MALPPRRPFKIPNSVTITYHKGDDGSISAHALDFDLVSSGASKEEAVKKIRTAIVSYIETGLLNEWSEDIQYPAPEQYWPAPGEKLEVVDPIYIMIPAPALEVALAVHTTPLEKRLCVDGVLRHGRASRRD